MEERHESAPPCLNQSESCTPADRGLVVLRDNCEVHRLQGTSINAESFDNTDKGPKYMHIAPPHLRQRGTLFRPLQIHSLNCSFRHIVPGFVVVVSLFHFWEGHSDHHISTVTIRSIVSAPHSTSGTGSFRITSRRAVCAWAALGYVRQNHLILRSKIFCIRQRRLQISQILFRST